MPSGILIKSQGPCWLYGTASEHSVLYQYQLYNAQDIFMSMVCALKSRFLLSCLLVFRFRQRARTTRHPKLLHPLHRLSDYTNRILTSPETARVRALDVSCHGRSLLPHLRTFKSVVLASTAGLLGAMKRA
jgi:hypothetical protein